MTTSTRAAVAATAVPVVLLVGGLTLVAGPAVLALAAVAAVLIGLPTLAVATLVWCLRRVGSRPNPAPIQHHPRPLYYGGQR